MVLARVRGGGTISKKSTFQIFPNFGRGGGEGVIENQFFPKSKIVQIILGGEGSRNLWTFSTISDIFCFDGFPNVPLFVGLFEVPLSICCSFVYQFILSLLVPCK